VSTGVPCCAWVQYLEEALEAAEVACDSGEELEGREGEEGEGGSTGEGGSSSEGESTEEEEQWEEAERDRGGEGGKRRREAGGRGQCGVKASGERRWGERRAAAE